MRSCRTTGATIALSVVAALAPCAIALNTSLDVSQYAHTAWKAGEGVSKGLIRSIAQTPDGYLWLGTEFGLLRFDGVRAVAWEPPQREHLPSTDIRSLKGARDGRLWIGTLTGLASWKDGKLTHYPELDGYTVEALLEDREGTIWAGGWASDIGRLCTIQNGSTQCYGEDGRFGSGVTVLCEDSRGNVWAAGTTGLWRWKPGPPKFYGIGDAAHSILALVESDDGGILIARHDGIIKLRNGRAEAYSLAAGTNIRPQRLFRDRDGGLWIGAAVDFGLLHIHEGTTDLFGPLQGLSGGSVVCLFQDREGSVWVATGDGLDRFRDFAVPRFSVEQGLASYGIDSVLAATDGSLWMGTSHGLNRWNKGQITVYRNRSEDDSRGAPRASVLGAGRRALPSRTAREIIDTGLPEDLYTSLFQDKAGKIWVATVAGVSFFESGRFSRIPAIPPGAVFSITDDLAGNVWLTHEGGLFRVFGRRVVERIPWAKLGRKKPANALLHDAGRGGLWLGFRDGGVAYFKDGQIRASYSSAEGLGQGMVRDFYIDGNGSLWIATDGGLSRIENGRVLTLTNQNGLPCNTVHWMREDDFHSVWLYLACGLVRIRRSELDAWVSHPTQTIQASVFDSSDGVSSHQNTGGYDTVVAKSADGRLWFVPFGGVSVIDPKHLYVNKLPPPVHIEQITVDDKSYDLKHGLRLPANVRNLRIEFTALSLVAPEKIHFKYKLEGQNQNWHELINERHATYTNLPPRNYRFRVMATNNSGVWNEAGDSIDFSIAPAYYQTNWFRALLAATVLVLMWAAYQFRMLQVQRESRRLRDVIETIPAYVWSALPDGLVDFINRRWLEFSGFSADQSQGWGWADAVHPEDRAGLLEKWRAAISSGEAVEAEARMRNADGQYRWLLFRSVPQRDQSGKIVKWYGQNTDIDDRKRAEEGRERLRQLEAEIAHINRVSVMGELAASVAHEVNQPLTGIVSNGAACLRFLAGDAPNLDEAREAVRDIVRDGKRAGEVIARIRALTKRAALPREELDLSETIREVLALVGDEAKKRSVLIRTQFADDLSPVLGDRVQLQQVLLNLVMNAMEAMSSVEKRQLVITTQNVDQERVQVTVEDSGTGLDPNIASRIFEPFYTTKTSGMGMGLSISRSIVQNHGGRLWATANDGPGTSFHFTLPEHRGEILRAGAGQ